MLDSCGDCRYRRGAHRRVRAELLGKVTGRAMPGTREDGYPAFLSLLFTEVLRRRILRTSPLTGFSEVRACFYAALCIAPVEYLYHWTGAKDYYRATTGPMR